MSPSDTVLSPSRAAVTIPHRGAPLLSLQWHLLVTAQRGRWCFSQLEKFFRMTEEYEFYRILSQFSLLSSLPLSCFGDVFFFLKYRYVTKCSVTIIHINVF